MREVHKPAARQMTRPTSPEEPDGGRVQPSAARRIGLWLPEVRPGGTELHTGPSRGH